MNEITENEKTNDTKINILPKAPRENSSKLEGADLNFSKKQMNVVKKVGVRKIAKVFVKLFGKLCGPCRGMVHRNPKVELERYCIKCQPIVKEELEALQ